MDELEFEIDVDVDGAKGEKDSKSFLLEPDLYNAVCVGIVNKDLPSYNDKNVKEKKVILIFQIQSGGDVYYVQSRPMKPSLYEKSAMWKMISDWTGFKTPEDFNKKYVINKKFSVLWFIGKPVRLTIDNVEVGENTYNNVKGYLKPAKDGTIVPNTEIGYPSFLVKGSTSFKFIDGLSVLAKKEEKSPDQIKAEEAKKLTEQRKALLEQQSDDDDDDDDDGLPF